jgi:L-amino acid N-acyltransferase YncA
MPLAIPKMLREAARYLASSSHSRWRQAEVLRELDPRLLKDIGVADRDVVLRRLWWRDVMGFNGTAPPNEQAAAITVRDASETDMDAVQGIYAHHVLSGTASFEETAPSTDELLARRRSVMTLGLPYLVAEQDGRIVGYCYASAYRPRPAYRHTIEDSVYVADGLGGRGIGRLLLSTLIERCEAGPWRQMLAIVGDSGNAGSIALHRSAGFRVVGTLASVGFKFGRWIDSVVMQRALCEGDRTLPGA